MGALDSAECSDLVGLYMLSKLSEKFDIKESGGLYRDDGMVAIKGSKKVIEKRENENRRYCLLPLEQILSSG